MARYHGKRHLNGNVNVTRFVKGIFVENGQVGI